MVFNDISTLVGLMPIIVFLCMIFVNEEFVSEYVWF